MRRASGITTTQLARICGVSQGTVDRALHDRAGIDPRTKEKILEVAREYDYVPHLKRCGEGGRSMLIGAVLFDLYNEFFAKFAMSLVEQTKRLGYSVIFLFSDKEMKEERAAVDYFSSVGVDGIILFSVGSDSEEYRNYLHTVRRPIVAVGNPLFDLTYIGIDDQRAMYDLTTEMIRQTGSGEIQYFAPILKRSLHRKNAQVQRVSGFQRAMEAHQRPFRIVCDEAELSVCATGTVCSTDHYLLKAIERLGSDTSQWLAGFDHIPSLDCLKKSILTLDYSTDRIAAECMNYFLKRDYQTDIAYRVFHHERG